MVSAQNLCSVLFCFVFLLARHRDMHTCLSDRNFCTVHRDTVLAISQVGTEEVKYQSWLFGNFSRIRHPWPPAPFSKDPPILEPQFPLLCFMPSYSFSATSHCLLCSSSALSITACAYSWRLPSGLYSHRDFSRENIQWPWVGAH